METATPIGVLGSGSFGRTIAYLISENRPVLIYARNEMTRAFVNTKYYQNKTLKHPIKAVSNLQQVCEQCQVLFPVVPSENFRSLMQDAAPYLRPYHILIHASKGFDQSARDNELTIKLEGMRLWRMSEIIVDESNVRRIGCLSGPNLAKEIMNDLPAAAVLASEFQEVRSVGRELLSSPKFSVYESSDLMGAELAGALKNVIALGSGILGGLHYGKNAQAYLITLGLNEMIKIANAMGSSAEAFLGVAGIGDLVATATSSKSRNYHYGFEIANNKTYSEIHEEEEDLAEGYHTIKLVVAYAQEKNIYIPLMIKIYNIIYHHADPKSTMDEIFSINTFMKN